MAPQVLHWLNGTPGLDLPPSDRGLAYGDGLFETFLYAHRRLLLRQYHLERLETGLAALGFPPSLNPVSDCLDQVCDSLAQREIATAALRLTVTRGCGPRGYTPPQQPQPNILISASVLEDDGQGQAAPAMVGLAAIQYASQPRLGGIKHLNRLEQVLASQERLEQGCDEMLMTDTQGHVVSVIAGNIFAVIDGRLVTPVLDHCGVLGTRRRCVIEHLGPALGLDVQECAITLEQLLGADEVFYTSSLMGIRPVKCLGSAVWRDHPVAIALHAQYTAERL